MNHASPTHLLQHTATSSNDDAMVCCISTLCMALRSSAQGPRGLNYGMGSFAIAGHGMPNFLVRRRSEYRLMPRHVFFCFFGKKSEAHKCCRDAICLNTPKIAWQGSTPEIFNVFAPGIAGFHLGEDWECCQWLQRRNSAERLNRKIGAFGSQVSCTRISYAEIANKWSQKVQVIFDSQALHQPFLYQTKVLLIRSWISPVDEIEWGWSLYIPWLRSTTVAPEAQEAPRQKSIAHGPVDEIEWGWSLYIPWLRSTTVAPEAQEAPRQKSIAHVHLSQKDGWQDCEGSKAQTSCKKWLSRLSISIPSSGINITRLELLSFPSNNSKADSSVLFQHISTFNQPKTHFRGLWTLNWRWIRIISATSLPEWLCASCESGWQRKTALTYVNKHKKHLKQQDCLLSLDFHSVHFLSYYQYYVFR